MHINPIANAIGYEHLYTYEHRLLTKLLATLHAVCAYNYLYYNNYMNIKHALLYYFLPM